MSNASIRYSAAFKRQVVEELRTGKWSTVAEVRRAYGITGAETVQLWIRKYGDPSMQRKVMVMCPDEQSELDRMRKRVKELEQALAQAKLDELVERSFYHVVCEEHGIKDPEAYKKNIESKRHRRDDD